MELVQHLAPYCVQGKAANSDALRQRCNRRLSGLGDGAALARIGPVRDVVALGSFGMKDRLLTFGVIGTVVAALCCFTPVLVWLLVGLGLAGLVGALDLVLLPTLGIFLCITGYALWRRHKRM